jgi:23S rRNA (pseudouridine1915-N3)-methyltransferase
VALDPSGEPLDSLGWSKLLGGFATEAVGRLVFLVGGAGGLSDPVRAAAHQVVSLGPQTVSHELAQVILAEQLYRAWTITGAMPQ